MPIANHRLDLGVLSDFKSLLSGDILTDLGEAVAAEFGGRVRMGAVGKTASGEPIDPNSPGWALRKKLEGRDPNPLMFYGDMTEPKAWSVSTVGDVVVLELNPEHQEKWDNIHELRNGRNWDEVWIVGDSEEELILLYIARYIEKELGLK